MYGRAMTPIGMWSLLGAASGYSPSSPSSAMSTIALARQFVDHALELAKRKIATLFPIARLNAARWLEDTSFRQLWLLTPRPSMPPGEVLASPRPLANR
jgi:hypothetical protein